MKREIKPVRGCEGTVLLPGDKSIGHRVALISLLAKEPVIIRNFPDNEDCGRSLDAAARLGVRVEKQSDVIILTPPETFITEPDMIIDCGNSGTTARLLSGIIAGSSIEVTLSGDSSLSRRPMKRIIDPLTELGGELFAEDDHLPMRIRGTKLLPADYTLPVASAQVKSAILLAALSSGTSAKIRENSITRDHTERMVAHLQGKIDIQDVKPVLTIDPVDPRKRKMTMPETFKREITIAHGTSLSGGEIDIPGDISTAAFFWAVAAITGGTVTVEEVGLNPTRTAFLNHLKTIGCEVRIDGKETISGEPRGSVTVTGGNLKARKIHGDTTVALIDELPIVAVMAAFAKGTTIIRDAQELRVKESDRLQAIEHNLMLMGVKCGTFEDGLAIEGGKELSGADFMSYGDHRIAMAFSIAGLSLDGPSTIDDDDVVAISCPGFYDLLDKLIK